MQILSCCLVQPGIYLATRQQLLRKMDLSLFKIIITVAFQNIFYSGKHQDDIFFNF